MKKLMDSVGINEYRIISGFDVQSLDIINQYVKLEKNNIPTPGHYGCLLSHIKAIEIAKNKKLPLKNLNIDRERAGGALLNDYRQGLLGSISLESPSSRFLKNKQT